MERAVARLPRTSLVALFAALDGASLPASELAVLRPLALVGDDGAPFGAVAARVRTASIARPDAFVTEPPAPPVVAANDSDAAAAAERAFTTVGALADVLLACLHTPLSRTGTGAVSAIDRRRLTDAGALGSVDDLDDLVAAAAAADLVTPLGREWIVTDAGTQWLEATTTRRWAVIAEGFRNAAAGGSAHRRRRLPAALELGGRLPARCRVDRTLRPAAPHRRSLGADHRGGHRAAVDRDAPGRRLPRHREPGGAPARRDRPRLPAGRPDRDRPRSARARPRSAPAHDRDARVARAGIDVPVHRRIARRGHDRGRDRGFDPRVPARNLADRHPAAAGLPHREHRRAARARPGARRRGHGTHASSRATDLALRDTIAVDQALRPLGLVRDGARAGLAGGARRGVLVARRRALPGRRARRVRRSGVSAPPHAGRGFDGPRSNRATRTRA